MRHSESPDLIGVRARMESEPHPLALGPEAILYSILDRVVDGFSQILRDMLTVNATLVAQQQNEEMRALTAASHAQGIEVKKISAWAAILFAPTLIGTVYGMSFARMPGLDSPHGFALSMTLMLGTRLGLSGCTWCSSAATGSSRDG